MCHCGWLWTCMWCWSKEMALVKGDTILYSPSIKNTYALYMWKPWLCILCRLTGRGEETRCHTENVCTKVGQRLALAPRIMKRKSLQVWTARWWLAKLYTVHNEISSSRLFVEAKGSLLYSQKFRYETPFLTPDKTSLHIQTSFHQASISLSIFLSMALQPFVGPWPLFQFFYLLRSR
jgi:hypothetical protein